MQPKAAKKIGGMTPKKIGGMAPKKMTGGTYGAEEEIKDYSYTITKQIDKENGMMKICVESKMPTGTMEVQPATDSSDDTPGAAASNGKPVSFINPDNNINAAKEAAAKEAAAPEASVDLEELEGGKKKRKSSKKRKSMKKKGGMKRKSMKVKA